MKKSYYHTFGATLADLDQVRDQLLKQFDWTFEKRESDYIGEYYKYSGLYADKITLERNYNEIEKEWEHEAYQAYPILITVSITNGKNKDKLSKSDYIKDQLLKLDGFVMIKESIFEDKD